MGVKLVASPTTSYRQLASWLGFPSDLLQPGILKWHSVLSAGDSGGRRGESVKGLGRAEGTR